MYYCRIIEIWYLLLFLPRTITQHLPIEEDEKSNNLAISRDTEDLNIGNIDIFQNDKAYPDKNYYYSNTEFTPIKRKEREIQEYEDYPEVKEMPRLSKTGLSLFSWWKSATDVKGSNSGTLPPLNVNSTNADISITVDPAAISTQPEAVANVSAISNVTNGSNIVNGSTTTNSINATNLNSAPNVTSTTTGPTYLTTCYTITLECSPLTIGTPVTCADIDTINKTSTFPTTLSSNTTVSVINATESGIFITAAGQNNSGATGSQNTNIMPTGNVANSVTSRVTEPAAIGNATSKLTESAAVGNISTVGTVPSIVNVVGAGMILPVYQLPMTPVIVLNTAPPIPPKSKSLKGINFNEMSLIATSKKNNISNINENPLQQNYSINNPNSFNRIYVKETAIPSNTKNLPIHSYVPMINRYSPKHESIKITNSANLKTNNSTIGALNYEETKYANETSILNQMERAKQTNEFSTEEQTLDAYETSLRPIENSVFVHQIKLDPNIGNEIENIYITHNPVKENSPSFYKPFNKIHKDQLLINQVRNSFNANSPLVFASSYKFKANATVKENNPQSLQNKAATDGERLTSFREFVKYDNSHLSKNSNITTNLVALCKNVTCQGNDYLAQCCSRICVPEKCKGEDFSYLHPIPGETTTVTSTTKICCNTVSNGSIGSNKVGINYRNYLVNFSCSPKQSSRVVRENDINDFVKFQLMHGLTAPDSKELMNALKEASVQMQKVNREIHSNDAENSIQANGNGQNVHQLQMLDKHRLSKKEPDCFISPIYRNKILDDLRATISNSLLNANLKPNPIQKNSFRIIRNQGFNDQLESIRENSMILNKLKEETETELKRLSFLEKRRREEEFLFNKERENDLKELKTIQELIHREFESRTQSDPGKRAISNTVQQALTNQQESPKKEGAYGKLLNNLENSVRNNDIDNLVLNRYSRMEGNRSNVIKSRFSSMDIEKFPELEINNSENNPHDGTLLVLNLDTDKDSLKEKQRGKREDYNNAKNKILKENMN